MEMFRVLGIGAITIVAVMLVVSFILYPSEINNRDFTRIMLQEGISNAFKGAHDYGACADDDAYNSTFTGTKNGQFVHGVICKGYSKGMTIRYF